MKTSTILLLAGGALALFYFGNLAQAGNVLQYYIAAVDFTGLTTGRITLMVQNPSNASIDLNSMAGSITVNNATLGNISNFQGAQIPANSQAPVVVQVALSLGTVLGTLFQALTQPNGATPLNFVISGNANINAGTIIPFSINQTVNV